MSAPICKECRDGKHGNCDGSALDFLSDEIMPCMCRDGSCSCPARETDLGRVACVKRRGHNGLHVWRFA